MLIAAIASIAICWLLRGARDATRLEYSMRLTLAKTPTDRGDK